MERIFKPHYALLLCNHILSKEDISKTKFGCNFYWLKCGIHFVPVFNKQSHTSEEVIERKQQFVRNASFLKSYNNELHIANKYT